jgi:hypothetical protein
LLGSRRLGLTPKHRIIVEGSIFLSAFIGATHNIEDAKLLCVDGVGCLGVVVVQLLLALGDGDGLTDLLVGRGKLLLGEVARLLRLFLHSYRLILLIGGRS